MWTKPIQSGGVVGGNTFAIAGDTYFEGSAYTSKIHQSDNSGRNALLHEPVSDGGRPKWTNVCVNLQTGQVIWTSTTMPAPSFGYIYDVQDPNQHGVYPPILIATSLGIPFGYIPMIG